MNLQAFLASKTKVIDGIYSRIFMINILLFCKQFYMTTAQKKITTNQVPLTFFCTSCYLRVNFVRRSCGCRQWFPATLAIHTVILQAISCSLQQSHRVLISPNTGGGSLQKFTHHAAPIWAHTVAPYGHYAHRSILSSEISRGSHRFSTWI